MHRQHRLLDDLRAKRLACAPPEFGDLENDRLHKRISIAG
jgi:hypothetical protein